VWAFPVRRGPTGTTTATTDNLKTERVEAKFKINRRPGCNLRAKSRLGPPALYSPGAKSRETLLEMTRPTGRLAARGRAEMSNGGRSRACSYQRFALPGTALAI
jgi:hypothetical protein